MIVAIDGLPIPPKTSNKIVLFLPEGELHEIGLLFYNYLARKAGYRTYYLGQNVPHSDLISVYKRHSPDLLVTAITSAPGLPIEEYLQQLQRDFPNTPIFISGYQVQRFSGVNLGNLHTFRTALELKQLL
jgi:hypothetical protein